MVLVKFGYSQKNVCKYCAEKGYAKRETLTNLLFRYHTGFSVYAEMKINYTKYASEDDKNKMAHIILYINKPLFSQEKIVFEEDGSNIIYRGEFHKGKKQNFVIFTPEDFIAAVTAHIPNKNQKLINYYGIL